MDVLEAIIKRKSIRKFISKPIEAEKLSQVFSAARLAPSWRNCQSWKFVVVTKPDLKKKLIRCTSTFNQSWLGKEHAIVIACGYPEKSGSNNGQPYYLVDVAIAMQHLVLAATELGLGTCWIGDFNEEKIKSLLSIPSTVRVVAISPLGYPAQKEGLSGKIARQVVKSKTRKPLDEVYSTNRWE